MDFRSSSARSERVILMKITYEACFSDEPWDGLGPRLSILAKSNIWQSE